MNAIKNTLETNANDAALQDEDSLILDSVEELSSVELAYVGGGTASVSFI